MVKGMKLMIHISICDNEATVREDIAGILNNCSKNIEITQFSTGEELLEAKNSFHIHIIDIELDNMSGIDVAKQIRLREKNKRSKSIIIFVTGYREYMEDAFDVNAFHYLVKPIDEKKMSTVFKRALKEAFARYNQEKQYVIVRYNGMQKKVLIKDIYYIESNNKKVVFHTKDGNIETYGKMDDWENELGDNFYRSHRCYLVNMEKITAYSVDTIDVVGGDSVIMARKKYPDFVKAYMRYAKDGGAVNV